MFLPLNHAASTEENDLKEDIREVFENRGFDGYSFLFWYQLMDCQRAAYQRWLKKLGRTSIPEISSELKTFTFGSAYAYAYDAEIPLRNKADLDILADKSAKSLIAFCGQIDNAADVAGAKFMAKMQG